ncbi:MAG: hypothetical protein FWC15_06640 [Fibromonadales bacterium]|nr:hypothetical protein [Fibromonadales bacterium]
MSAEFIRRRLVIRLNGTPDKVYIDKIAKAMVALEKELDSEIEFVNPPAGSSIAAKFKNGESYEFTNYQDPRRDKPKPPGYKPPEIEHKKLEIAIKEDKSSESGEFGIFQFCLYAFFVVIAVLDVVIFWAVIAQFR